MNIVKILSASFYKLAIQTSAISTLNIDGRFVPQPLYAKLSIPNSMNKSSNNGLEYFYSNAVVPLQNRTKISNRRVKKYIYLNRIAHKIQTNKECFT
jgi:hypothetical protein